ncbi:MAG: hypothetical protein D6694_04980 [Gammaproteobacteria bacterium]|nr:MAG: hypothetical protein D6694_04980 [Gammaproteobacteria bacterium]
MTKELVITDTSHRTFTPLLLRNGQIGKLLTTNNCEGKDKWAKHLFQKQIGHTISGQKQPQIL